MMETAAGHNRGLRPWQRWVLTGAVLLITAVALTGPYLAVVQYQRQGQQIAEIKKEEAGTRQLLQFVADVQNGPQAKAGREATGWYVRQLQSICAHTAGCVPVRLPDSLKAAAGASAATTGPP